MPSPRTARRRTAGPTPERRKRAREVLAGLKSLYPDADCALHHRSAYELLVATILSAQSTDANVNKVTPALFARFPDAPALARADPADVERLIHSTGFFRQKTKSLLGAAKRMVEAFGGEVPGTLDELVTLPGVARKTANVILGTWFKVNEGVVVDTHVGRLAQRLGLTWTSRGEKDAGRIEVDLQQILPRDDWAFFGHAMILHGRRVCAARKPNCDACALAACCPSAFKVDRGRERGRQVKAAGRPARQRRGGSRG
jgi:endonuclease-3